MDVYRRKKRGRGRREAGETREGSIIYIEVLDGESYWYK
jgi:hypothetical protein